jgi:hypothetical protein
MRAISRATPKRRILRPPKFLITRETVKAPIMRPVGAAIANPPIKVLLTPRDSKISDSKGVNRLLVIP